MPGAAQQQNHAECPDAPVHLLRTPIAVDVMVSAIILRRCREFRRVSTASASQ
jgi:hypothetical protein